MVPMAQTLCLVYLVLFMALVALMHKLKEKLVLCKIHLIRRVQSRAVLTVVVILTNEIRGISAEVGTSVIHSHVNKCQMQIGCFQSGLGGAQLQMFMVI